MSKKNCSRTAKYGHRLDFHLGDRSGIIVKKKKKKKKNYDNGLIL